jgi:uncharacterized protein
MAGTKHQGRIGGTPPVRPDAEPKAIPQETQREEPKMVSATAVRTQPQQLEGIAVVGEAVRRVVPESAQFLVEIATNGHTASQSLTNHQNLISQIAQAVSGMGINRGDLQTVSMNVANVYAPALAAPPYAVPQIAPAGFPGFPAQPVLQPDVQFGTYQARSMLRVTVREAARVGEIADALTKAGANLIGAVSYSAADESSARKSVLEAAGKDARTKAETLAAASGKQLGEPVHIAEEVIASNGVYAAMRAQMPWAFGPDTPVVAGELEYYARVTASFRFQ